MVDVGGDEFSTSFLEVGVAGSAAGFADFEDFSPLLELPPLSFFVAGVPIMSLESRLIVTGPSLCNATSMYPPNTPAFTLEGSVCSDFTRSTNSEKK